MVTRQTAPLLCLPTCPCALLLPLQHFHSALDLRQAAAAAAGDAPAAPTMNPLQQAPTPAAGKGRAAAGASPLSGPAAADFGLGGGGFGGPGAGEEAGNISRAVTRGLSISPQKLNDFAKVVRGLHIQDALIQVGAWLGVWLMVWLMVWLVSASGVEVGVRLPGCLCWTAWQPTMHCASGLPCPPATPALLPPTHSACHSPSAPQSQQRPCS
jgi:hypothetical protein